MTIQANKNANDILRMENQESLMLKLSRVSELDDKKIDLENETIEFLTSELINHGKDANQVRQTSQISKVLGQSLGLGSEYCEVLEKAAKIYDIGNITIASEIYEKEDKLSYEEFVVIKEHPLFGYDILVDRGFASTDLGALVSKEHHEWWNGGGYPSRLKAEEINIASRIVALADTVGALYSKRPGRHVWSYEKILDYIKERSGLQFDPAVVDVFLINQEVIEEILKSELEDAPSSWYM